MKTRCTRASDLEDVTAVLDHQFAVIDPPLCEVADAFTYQTWTFEPGGPHGVRRAARPQELFTFDFRGRLAVPSGLWPRVRRLLEDQGRRVAVEDLRKFGPRLRPDRRLVDDTGFARHALLQAAAREPRGQVEVADAADAIATCAALARLYPKARVAVAAATRRAAWQVWRALGMELGHSVGLVVGGARHRSRRLTVYAFAGLPPWEEGRADLLLLPFAEEATGDRAADVNSLRWFVVNLTSDDLLPAGRGFALLVSSSIHASLHPALPGRCHWLGFDSDDRDGPIQVPASKPMPAIVIFTYAAHVGSNAGVLVRGSAGAGDLCARWLSAQNDGGNLFIGIDDDAAPRVTVDDDAVAALVEDAAGQPRSASSHAERRAGCAGAIRGRREPLAGAGWSAVQNSGRKDSDFSTSITSRRRGRASGAGRRRRPAPPAWRSTARPGLSVGSCVRPATRPKAPARLRRLSARGLGASRTSLRPATPARGSSSAPAGRRRDGSRCGSL
jgi:hypothetical protein